MAGHAPRANAGRRSATIGVAGRRAAETQRAAPHRPTLVPGKPVIPVPIPVPVPVPVPGWFLRVVPVVFVTALLVPVAVHESPEVRRVEPENVGGRLRRLLRHASRHRLRHRVHVLRGGVERADVPAAVSVTSFEAARASALSRSPRVGGVARHDARVVLRRGDLGPSLERVASQTPHAVQQPSLRVDVERAPKQVTLPRQSRHGPANLDRDSLLHPHLGSARRRVTPPPIASDRRRGFSFRAMKLICPR